MIDVEAYVGRSEVRHDVADPERLARLAATLDHGAAPSASGMLPPLGHWLCFRPDERQSAIGPDGHARRTDEGLLPNVDLPRRMWAGSRVRFLRDVPLGAALTRTSTLAAVTRKAGRSGTLLFATVRHEIAGADGALAIVEDQDIVYRDAANGVAVARPAVAFAPSEDIVRSLVPDPVLLFRYSALTFNGHRIHYDREYCIVEEGYPGLVVHGPLIANLLLDHLLRRSPRARVQAFDFRAVSPMFDGETLELRMVPGAGEEEVTLRATGPVGVVMEACATIIG